MTSPLTKDQYDAAIDNPDIAFGPVVQNGMREFDLNGNETIATYPGINSPTSYWQFRAALAELTDKQYMVNNICGGLAQRMDVPIQASAPSWLNSSVIYPNYPWEYNPLGAASLLDAAGFIEGDTTNPYYDSGFPGSVQHLRLYPSYAVVHDNPQIDTDINGPPYSWALTFTAISVLRVMGVPADGHIYKDLLYTFNSNTVTVSSPTLKAGTYLWIEYKKAHPKAGQDLDPVIVYVRSGDPSRKVAGELLVDNMRKAGVPVSLLEGNSAFTRPPVMTDRDYHIYTGGWSLGRYPTSIYSLYNSEEWFPDGANYINPPCPRPSLGPCVADPNIDVYSEDIYSSDSIASAIAAAQGAQYLITEYCVNIPLWTPKSFYAWRSWLLGLVSEPGNGPINDYTFMNAYKASGSPEQGILRLGMTQPPESGNVLYAQSGLDYSLLDRYWQNGVTNAPYDLGGDQPWVVQDWTPTTWVDPDNGETKTACIYWLRENVKWAAPVTGNYIRSFTADDAEFSNMFSYFFDDSWNWGNTANIDHIEVVDQYTFKVCFSSTSYWFQYAATYPLLPKNEWGALFCTPTVYSEEGASYAAGDSLIVNEGHGVAQVQSITVNGASFTNYWVRFSGTGDAHSANRIYFRSAVSGDLIINYWNVTGDVHGYYPGSETDWASTSYSIGEYVPVDITKDTWAVFKRNDYFFITTPPLGEIDWHWYWGVRNTTRPLGGPRTGEFAVDTYDLNYVVSSYGSTGYGNGYGPSTDPPWFPGADLAPSYMGEAPYGGKIDFYDLMIVSAAIAVPTPKGENVTVSPLNGVDLTFDNVTVAGSTTLIKNATGPELPSGFELFGEYYDIQTTAHYSGQIEVKIAYDDAGMTQVAEEALRLREWNTTEWIDITTYADTVNNVIYGMAPHLSMFGVTTVEPLSMFGVTVADSLCSKTVVGEGYNLIMNVTIRNQGDYAKTFDLFAYAIGALSFVVIGKETISNLLPHSEVIVTFAWNTSGCFKGIYIISANDQPLGSANVTIPGDVDGTFEVDIYDVTAICVCYDSKLGPPRDPLYYPNCDLDGNGIVDIFDVTTACITYGQKYP
jgi:ABC-type transport system substrate-binding protein